MNDIYRRLTKQEIIDKLNALPDLPVVVRADTEQIQLYGPTDVRVEKAYLYGDKFGEEWNTSHDPLQKGLQDVIVITY